VRFPRLISRLQLTPDAFFQNVCELDLVFSFYKVYAILDEVFLAGEIEETSKQVVLDRLDYLEKLD
jgi:AP-2 complex subunit sigma-1